MITLLAMLATMQSGGQDERETYRDYVCPPAQQAAATARLKEIYDADVASRTGSSGSDGSIEDMEKAMEADKERRREVADIFATGCMRTGEDFYHGGLVFQHGSVPEHFIQALIFFVVAGERGDHRAAYLIPRAVDRYLMQTGRKQLYGTNLKSHDMTTENGETARYFCLWPMEESFPKGRLQAAIDAGYARSMEGIEEWVRNNNAGELPPFGLVCPVEAAPAPEGSVPGHW